MVNYPIPNEPFHKQEALTLLAMAIFGEARGQSREAKFAVASVIRNRRVADITFWKHGPGPTDWHRVILHPFAFSSFLKSDPNAVKMLNPLKHERRAVWEDCCIVAEAVFAGEAEDMTHGCDHYFDDSIRSPKWAAPEKFVTKIDRLNFYRLYLNKR